MSLSGLVAANVLAQTEAAAAAPKDNQSAHERMQPQRMEINYRNVGIHFPMQFISTPKYLSSIRFKDVARKTL